MSGFGFNPRAMDNMVNSLGQPVTWQRALLCPCRASRTGGADVTCTVCGGNSYTYDDPIETRVALQEMKTSRQWAQFSEVERGDILCTIPTDSLAYEAGEYDRITYGDGSLRVTHVLKRGENDTLKYHFPIAIIKVWAVINNAIVSVDRYTDFTLTGNVLTWITSTIPVGQAYSVLYTAKPEYFVFRDLVTDRQHGGVALPRKVQLRLMDLMSRALA